MIVSPQPQVPYHNTIFSRKYLLYFITQCARFTQSYYGGISHENHRKTSSNSSQQVGCSIFRSEIQRPDCEVMV